jgi:hypothetical protein
LLLKGDSRKDSQRNGMSFEQWNGFGI